MECFKERFRRPRIGHGGILSEPESLTDSRTPLVHIAAAVSSFARSLRKILLQRFPLTRLPHHPASLEFTVNRKLGGLPAAISCSKCRCPRKSAFRVMNVGMAVL